MILLASQVFIFLLMIQSTYGIQAKAASASDEAAKASLARGLEMFSYNALLDLCAGVKEAVNDFAMHGNITEIEGGVKARAEGWRSAVEAYAHEELNAEAEIIIEINISNYVGQQVDRIEMSFIGGALDPKWYVSGSLLISIKQGDCSRTDHFGIRIAV